MARSSGTERAAYLYGGKGWRSIIWLLLMLFVFTSVTRRIGAQPIGAESIGQQQSGGAGAAPDVNAAPSQAPPAAGQQPAPPAKGTVLYERHTPPIEETPVDQPDPARPTDPTPLPQKTGAARTRRGLQRRPEAGAAQAGAAQTPPDKAAENNDDHSVSSDVPTLELATPPPTSSHSNAADQKAAAAIPDRDRSALQIATSYLDMHLNQHTGEVTVRARLLVRNGGDIAIIRLPVQISSALRWQSAQLLPATGASLPLGLQQYTLQTDLDHTGAVTELALDLPKPLAPGATASLDLFYGGTLLPSAERLLRLGAPAERASLADWDTVSDEFTGLRGVGNVLWYPVVAAPVFLGDGVAFTQQVDDLRLSASTERMRLRLTVEYTGGAPDAAFFLDERKPLLALGALPATASSSSSSSSDAASSTTPDEVGSDHDSGIVTAEWPLAVLGARTPSLFLASTAAQSSSEAPLETITNSPDAAAAYVSAAAAVKPLLSEWLGPVPASPLVVLDLPRPGAAPFADGALLVTPMHASDPAHLAPALAYSLASAWLPQSVTAPWLREGLPAFLRTLYLERSAGREAALTELAADGDLLAREEAFATPESVPLSRCAGAVCSRTKATYVFEMLRTLAGEDALKQAISGWLISVAKDPAKADAASLEALITRTSGKDLHWFFADWVERDAGLPELTIVTVAPRRVERATAANTIPAQRRSVAGPVGPEPVPLPGDPQSVPPERTSAGNGLAPAEGSWLVAVEVANNGSAAAQVPVTVSSGSLTNTVALRVPAHGRATVRVPFEAEPQEVQVNDGTVPELRTSTHRKGIANLP